MTNMTRVLRHQKKAIRILGDLEARESCREKFKELKILTSVGLFILEVIIHNRTKTHQPLKTGSQIHNYNTRHASNHCLPAHRLTLYKEKPSYMGAKLWNLLPEAVKGTDDQQLKRRISTWLQDNPFYTLNEYMNWKTPT